MNQAARSPLLQAALSKGKYVKYAKDQALKSSDEKQDIILVRKGFIKRYLISNDGSLGTQIIYGPNDVFPLTTVYRVLLGQSLYSGQEVYHYSAMSDCWVYALDSEEFEEEVRLNPGIYKDLFSEAGHHLATTVQRLENMAIGNAYSRVAHILLFYVKKFGEEMPGGVRIGVHLTHQDIAHILNLSRETVTTSMIKLRKEGIIDKDSGRILVVDMDSLSKTAYGKTNGTV